jgi:hypothetical protein
VSEISEHLPFLILDETSKPFPKFHATGRSLLIKFRPSAEDVERILYLKECISALTNYLVKDVRDRYLVGLRIRNTQNVHDKVVGISFRRRDQLKHDDVVWGVLGKVVQCNARFGLCDRLEVHLNNVRMPNGKGKRSQKTKGRSLDVLSAIKWSIVVFQEAIFCLVHALIIAISRVNGNHKQKSYRKSKGLKQPVE